MAIIEVGTESSCFRYSDRRGGGAGDFVGGFLLGGAVFGALGYILAPQVGATTCFFCTESKAGAVLPGSSVANFLVRSS